MGLIGYLMRLGPILFGLGFVAPVLAAIFVGLGWTAPMGLPSIYLGLLVGGVLGGIAWWRSRWI